jgi:hypothetical protein
MSSKPVVGFAKIDKAVITTETIVHFSPEAWDFLETQTDTRPNPWGAWQAKTVAFDLLADVPMGGSCMTFSDEKESLTERPRLYMKRDKFRGKRVILEKDMSPRSCVFTDAHRSALQLALKEFADAVRAAATTESAFGPDLQTF